MVSRGEDTVVETGFNVRECGNFTVFHDSILNLSVYFAIVLCYILMFPCSLVSRVV